MMSEVIRAYLGMKYDLVGIKINPAENKDPHPSEPMWFCQMVREAALGKEFTISPDDLACPNAELALGFRAPKYVRIEPRIKEEVKTVRIGPLEGADVVLLILVPEQVMTLSILLGGLSPEFKGEMGVCGEAVARVYEEKKPNLSFLCNGARLLGGFRPNEVILGLPTEDFANLNRRIENLLKTGGSLCGCQVSDIPSEMVRGFKEAGLEKGADYFFGKIKGRQVRVYLNKDETGRFKQLTLYLPLKGEEIEVKPPFQSRRRGEWLDVYTVLDPQSLGVDLYTGKNLKDVLERLTGQALGG